MSAAIVLAQAGWHVDVCEAEAQPGGGARTMELTLPGFHHDAGSAVHPLAAASPFFSTLPLQQHGLEWIEPPAALAHPLDDGTAVMLYRDLRATQEGLGRDGRAWQRVMQPFVDHWQEFSAEALGPVPLVPRHPWLMARFGALAFPPATKVSSVLFREDRTKALFAGLAAHSFLNLDAPLSSAFGMLLGVAAHVVGWPIPRRGAQAITTALCKYLFEHGGELKTSTRIGNIAELDGYELVLCDVTPRQLLHIAGDRLSQEYKRRLGRFRYGPGAFKVDYALSAPIPWRAPECAQAATLHLGGTAAEVATSEREVSDGKPAERPYVLLSQPSLFDALRAPQGKHIAWAYCHVPNGSDFDMLPRLEAQIERFAPGFRDCVLARHVSSPAALEKMNANLVGGDINGGALDVRQFLFRPTGRYYATSARNLFICSSSTPPGGGVHGMCGFHAARWALRSRESR